MADNLKLINCPACGKKMAKIPMKELGIFLDLCLDGCGGIYFDNRELEYFDEKHESIDEILQAIRGQTFTKTDESAKRTCPVCGAVMVKHFTSVLKEVEIDECYACGGKFLDHGELIKIRSEYDTEEERSEEAAKFFEAVVSNEYKARAEAKAEADKNKSALKRLLDGLLKGED